MEWSYLCWWYTQWCIIILCWQVVTNPGPWTWLLGGPISKNAYRKLNTPKGEIGFGLMMSALRTSQYGSFILLAILVSCYAIWIYMTLLESPHGACQRLIDIVGGKLRGNKGTKDILSQVLNKLWPALVAGTLSLVMELGSFSLAFGSSELL